MNKLPIDWATVDWVNVGILSAAVLIAGLIGHAIAFGNRFFGSVLTAVLFGAFFVAWTYWLRELAGTSLGRPI